MKRLIAVLFPAALLFCGCYPSINGSEIREKEFTGRDCICKYGVIDPVGNYLQFEDSCSLYRVGDKIGKKR